MNIGPSRSLFERTANIIACFGLTVALRLLLFPAFGLQQTFGQSLKLGLSFTASLLLRRTAWLWLFVHPSSP